MGAPISGILLGIFLQEREETFFKNLKVNYITIAISRYVNNDDKYNEETIVKELNKLHKKQIHYTKDGKYESCQDGYIR